MEPVRQSIFKLVDLKSSKIMILGAGIGLLPLFLNKFNKQFVAGKIIN